MESNVIDLLIPESMIYSIKEYKYFLREYECYIKVCGKKIKCLISNELIYTGYSMFDSKIHSHTSCFKINIVETITNKDIIKFFIDNSINVIVRCGDVEISCYPSYHISRYRGEAPYIQDLVIIEK